MTFSDFKNRLEVLGKQMFGPEFKVFSSDDELLYRLYVYFTTNIEEADRLKIELKKGILLAGPVGCGKTSILQVINRMRGREGLYIVKSCRDVAYEFMKGGDEAIQKYGRKSFDYNNDPKSYCFDDLGVENSVKFYGNECNVMSDILLTRYDMFVSKEMKTLITTNLTSDEIEESYGTRVRSRLREMCNLFSFDENAEDKRK